MIKNLCKSFGFAVLMVLFPVLASVIIQINAITDDTAGYGIQALFFGIACVIGFILYKKYKRKSETSCWVTKKEMLWLLPLLISELLGFIMGVKITQDFLYYFVLIMFTIFVAISEELFFRGIVLEILREKNVKYAIIVSSIFFSFLHLTNLAGGISMNYAIFQMVFAFIFGYVAAQITILSKSIFPAIVWHFAHNFITLITGNRIDLIAIVILGIQCVILIIYSIYLSKKIKRQIYG